MKRSRGRGRRPSNPGNRSYDSNGPDVRVRGTASQVYEKYQTLARDAQLSGDRVGAENYMQHAEHYYRIQLSTQPVRTETANADEDFDDAEGIEEQREAVTEMRGASVHDNAGGEDEDVANNANLDSEEAGEASYEPLILKRDGSEQEDDKAGEVRSAKTGRRRGPLRRRPAAKTAEENADAAAGE